MTVLPLLGRPSLGRWKRPLDWRQAPLQTLMPGLKMVTHTQKKQKNLKFQSKSLAPFSLSFLKSYFRKSLSIHSLQQEFLSWDLTPWNCVMFPLRCVWVSSEKRAWGWQEVLGRKGDGGGGIFSPFDQGNIHINQFLSLISTEEKNDQRPWKEKS